MSVRTLQCICRSSSSRWSLAAETDRAKPRFISSQPLQSVSLLDWWTYGGLSSEDQSLDNQCIQSRIICCNILIFDGWIVCWSGLGISYTAQDTQRTEKNLTVGQGTADTVPGRHEYRWHALVPMSSCLTSFLLHTVCIVYFPQFASSICPVCCPPCQLLGISNSCGEGSSTVHASTCS